MPAPARRIPPPGTRLPRVYPGKPPYTARAPPPGNTPAPRRRARHAAFVGPTRPSPARAPLAARRLAKSPRLPRRKRPPCRPAQPPAARRPDEKPARVRPAEAHRRLFAAPARLRHSRRPAPPRSAVPPRGDRIPRLFQLETAAPSRVNFRKIPGWGYWFQNKKRPPRRTISVGIPNGYLSR